MERTYSNVSVFQDYFTRFQLTQCHICTIKYNKTDRKPMTMCLEAMHVICQICFNDLRNKQNMDRCTICRNSSYTNLFNQNHKNKIMMSVLDYEQFLKQKHARDMKNKDDQINKLQASKKTLEGQVIKLKQQNKQMSKLKVQINNLKFQYNRKYQQKLARALFLLERQKGLIVGHLAQNIQKETKPFVLQKIKQYQDSIVELKFQMNELMHTIFKQQLQIDSLINNRQKINNLQQRSLAETQIDRTQNQIFSDATKKLFKKKLQKQMSCQYQQFQEKFNNLEQILQKQDHLEKYRKNSSTSSNCATIDSQSQQQD